MPKSEFEKRRTRRTIPLNARLHGLWLTFKITVALWRGNPNRAKQILFELKRTVRPLPRFAQWFDSIQQEPATKRTFAPTL